MNKKTGNCINLQIKSITRKINQNKREKAKNKHCAKYERKLRKT